MSENAWKKVWNNRTFDLDEIEKETDIAEKFMKLKGLVGIKKIDDSKKRIEYSDFMEQFRINLRELAFSHDPGFSPSSFFDLGCGTGAYLCLLNSMDKKYKLGGADYSAPFVDVARRVVPDAEELYCSNAEDISTDIKYDCVFSRSIFQYFSDVDYAAEVVGKMIEKADHSVGIFDVHDAAKKEEFLNYRRSIIEDYDKKYAETQHLFFDKAFFIDISEKYRVDVKFAKNSIENYWNAPFTYDVYFYKR